MGIAEARRKLPVTSSSDLNRVGTYGGEEVEPSVASSPDEIHFVRHESSEGVPNYEPNVASRSPSIRRHPSQTTLQGKHTPASTLRKSSVHSLVAKMQVCMSDKLAFLNKRIANILLAMECSFPFSRIQHLQAQDRSAASTTTA